MNTYEQKGVEFLKKIEYLVVRPNLKTKDSLFDVLDCISLKQGYHIGLKVAREVGMGDESFFYTYYDEDYFKDGFLLGSIHETSIELFGNLKAEPSEMGAWQVYLLWMSPTVLPFFWHGGYIHRQYFFDRDHYENPLLFCGKQMPEEFKPDIIPQPTVIMEGNKAIVTCPYWNNWEGLVLESKHISINTDGEIDIQEGGHKTLYEYDCGICY